MESRTSTMNVTYPEFVEAATGKRPPTFPDNDNGQGDKDKDDSESNSDTDSQQDQEDADEEQGDDYDDNQYSGQWSIIPEIGDGACLLRCISRSVYNTPDMHDIVRQDIINHITNNLHNPVPGTGGQTYHQSIAVGVHQEQVQVAGSAPTTYSSVEEYLAFQSQTYAYATQVEIVAAQQVYGKQFRVTIQGSPYPQPPQDNNVADILYDTSSLHYSTLSYSSN